MYNYLIEIDGMRCSMCEAHINDIIRKSFKGKKVKSSHKLNISTFISKEMIDKSVIKNEIEKTGYRVNNVIIEEIIK